MNCPSCGKDKVKNYNTIIVLILSIIIILLSLFLVLILNRDYHVEIKTSELTSKPSQKIDNFYDVYDENAIVLNLDYFKQLISIDGLKNKEVLNKINTKIKDETKKLNLEDGQLPSWYHDELNVDHMQTSPFIEGFKVYANFGNLISLLGFAGSEMVALNLNLNTGEELTLKDLFKSEVDYLEIIKNNSRVIVDEEEGDYHEAKVLDSETIQEIAKGDYVFYFDNLGIYITTTSGFRLETLIYNSRDYFAYFDAYLDKSIFENPNLGLKGLSINSSFDLKHYYVTHLFKDKYLDISVDALFTDFTEEDYIFTVEKLNAYLNQKIASNEEEMVIIKGTLDAGDFSINGVNVKALGATSLQVCALSKETLTSAEFKEKILDSRVYFDSLNFVENCTSLPSFALYFKEDYTYKFYDKVEDIFMSNDLESLEEAFSQNLEHKNIQDKEYFFTGNGFKLTYTLIEGDKTYEDIRALIYFKDFDLNKLNLASALKIN